MIKDLKTNVIEQQDLIKQLQEVKGKLELSQMIAYGISLILLIILVVVLVRRMKKKHK